MRGVRRAGARGPASVRASALRGKPAEVGGAGLRAPGRAAGARHAGGRWPVAGGRWPVAGGRWPVAGGRWPVAGGRWPVAGGRWPVAGGRWPVAGGRWPVAGGRWPIIRAYTRARRGRCQAPIRRPGRSAVAAGGRRVEIEARTCVRTGGRVRFERVRHGSLSSTGRVRPGNWLLGVPALRLSRPPLDAPFVARLVRDGRRQPIARILDGAVASTTRAIYDLPGGIANRIPV